MKWTPTWRCLDKTYPVAEKIPTQFDQQVWNMFELQKFGNPQGRPGPISTNASLAYLC